MHLLLSGIVAAALSLPASSLSLVAQTAPSGTAAAGAAGCPVSFTDAGYTRHATPLPVPDPNATTNDRAYGTLDFHYRSESDKPIRSFRVAAMFARQQGVRPPLLRTPNGDMEHYAQSDPLGAHDAGSARYEVRKDVGALQWIRLDRVDFQDGTEWNAAAGGSENPCTYRPKAKARLTGERSRP